MLCISYYNTLTESYCMIGNINERKWCLFSFEKLNIDKFRLTCQYISFCYYFLLLIKQSDVKLTPYMSINFLRGSDFCGFCAHFYPQKVVLLYNGNIRKITLPQSTYKLMKQYCICLKINKCVHKKSLRFSNFVLA